MAQIYGEPGNEPGDRLVHNALSYLPDGFIIYAQKKIVYRREERNPDYVILHRDLGVIVLEVKDWVKIEGRDDRNARVYRTTNRRVEIETSPVEQARQAALLLVDRLKADPELRNYAGKLDFPFRYAGALPHLPMPTITWLEQAWGKDKLIGRDDLTADRIHDKIRKIPAPLHCPMTERQFNAVRAILDPLNRVEDPQTGRFKGVYSDRQEAIAKQPPAKGTDGSREKDARARQDPPAAQQGSLLHEPWPKPDDRRTYLDQTAPPEVTDLKDTAYIRLVRGFAGTGKTDVLILRAHHLRRQYPDKDILVTTFNRPLMEERLQPALKGVADVFTFDELCSQIFKKKHGVWVLPQSAEGVIAHLATEFPLVERYGQRFLADEITWMKENGLTERQKYLNTHREGRAGQSRMLSRRQKEEIFDLFERYQAELKEISPHDWADLHEKVLGYLRGGIEPNKRYDDILIDEAQHFAPDWIRVLRFFLKAEGELFLCDDPSQSVYRLYSWRQRGIEVVGRTRWLRTPYRNTRQIFEAAFALIEANPLARKMLEEGESLPEPDLKSDFLREGEFPHVYQFENQAVEKEFVLEKTKELISGGLLPTEICLLHTQKHVIQAYRTFLPKEIKVDDLRRRTGMEYPAVFIPRVQELFDRNAQCSWEEDQAQQQLALYMAMTRARDYLYLLYEQKWPKPFDPIRPRVLWHLAGSSPSIHA